MGSLKKNLEDNNCDVMKGDINHNESVGWEETSDERKKMLKNILQAMFWD
jgi:hypothetical protein